ncbi:conserved hypothetical protein [Gammaproteobacteria bacterium]
MKSGHQALAIVVLAAFLAAAYTFWVAGTAAPELAETNYEANLIRLEQYFYGPPARVVLAGSSLTGRLLASYFTANGVGPVMNLGLDGSSPQVGLEMIRRRDLFPKLVLVEANLLGKPVTTNDHLLEEVIDSWTFRLADQFSIFRASSRPSTHLYAAFKMRRDETADVPPESTISPSPSRSVGAMPEINAIEIAAKAGIKARLLELRQRGAQVMFFRIPAGKPWNTTPTADLAADLATELQAPMLDLQGALLARGAMLNYTDGRHLAAPSARLAASVLVELWTKVGKERGQVFPFDRKKERLDPALPP